MGLPLQQHEARATAEDNIGLVYSIAIELRHLPLSREDLVSEGCMGLMKAADRFNPSRGTKFSSYAATWIKQSMYRAAEKYGSEIRVPSWTLARIRHARKLKTGNAHAASPDETMDAGQIEKYIGLGNSVHTISIYDKHHEDFQIIESLRDSDEKLPDSEIAVTERSEMIKESLAKLDERERRILQLYFGLGTGKPMTHLEIAKALGLSRERVRQLQHEAISKMRHDLKNCQELFSE